MIKQKIGLPRVSARVMQMYPEHESQLWDLKKWIDNQRNFYHNGISENGKHTLSDERLRMLVQAGFDFNSQSSKPLHWKGWNDKLNALREFKEK